MNIEKVRQAIEDLPICKEGKEKVTVLLEEITGEIISPKKKTHRIGTTYLDGSGGRYFLAQVLPHKVCLIDSRGNRMLDPERVKDIYAITESEFLSLSMIAGELKPE